MEESAVSEKESTAHFLKLQEKMEAVGEPFNLTNPNFYACLEKNEDVFDHVVVLMTYYSESELRKGTVVEPKSAEEMEKGEVLSIFLSHATKHPNPVSMQLFGRFLTRLTAHKVAPLITQEIYDILTDAVNKRNYIPPGPAEKCLTFLARNPSNHSFLIEHGAVEFFLSQLTLKLSEDYLVALYNIALLHESVRKKFGEDDVYVVLRMVLHNLPPSPPPSPPPPPPAAQLLLLLVNTQTNREIVRNDDGVKMLLDFTKATHQHIGLQILSHLAIEDDSIFLKMFLELGEWLMEVLKGPPHESQTAIIQWMQFLNTSKDSTHDTAPVLRKLVNCGAIEAVFQTPVIDSKEKLALIAGLAGPNANPKENYRPLYQALDAVQGLVEFLIDCISKEREDANSGGYALIVLQQYFVSLVSEGKTQHKLHSIPMMRMVAHLMFFIEQNKHVAASIIALSGAISIARAIVIPFHLAPLLPKMIQFGRENSADNFLIPAILDIILTLTNSRAIDFNVLMSEEVISFLQFVTTEDVFTEKAAPILKIFYTHHEPDPTDRFPPEKFPVLKLLTKNGIPTSKYVMALVKGGAVRAMLRDLNNWTKWKFAMPGVLQRLSFFGAEEIAQRPNMVKALVTYVAKEMPLPTANVVWMLTLRKRSRRKMSQEDLKEVRKFALEFPPLSASRQMKHLKAAILTNLNASADGDSDGEGADAVSLPTFSPNRPHTPPPDPIAEILAEQPSAKGKSKKKKKKKEKEGPPPPTESKKEKGKEPKPTEVINILVPRFHAMCEKAARDMLRNRGNNTTEDNYENIMLFYEYLTPDIKPSIRPDVCCVFILNAWLYGNPKQILIATELLTAILISLREKGFYENEFLTDMVPVLMKYIAGGRGISPVHPIAQDTICSVLGEWGVEHRSSLLSTMQHNNFLADEKAEAKNQDEIKKMKDTIASQKQTISALSRTESTLNSTIKKLNEKIEQQDKKIATLQQTNEQLHKNTEQQITEIQMQKELEIHQLTTQLEKIQLEQNAPKDTKLILDSLDLESIDNLADFTKAYSHLKAKVKAAKQRKAKLKAEKQDQDEKAKAALLCPICQDNRITLTCNPCGHAFCKQCTDIMFPKNGKICPICRTNVKSTINIYL